MFKYKVSGKSPLLKLARQ